MTVKHATSEELQAIAASKTKALIAAYEMLCEIQAGHNFDTADYMLRKSAIAAAIDGPAKCPTCHGYKNIAPKGRRGRVTVPCPDCGGTGAAPAVAQCVPADELAAELAALSPADRAALPRPITDTTDNGIEWTCRPGGPWNAETVVTLHAADRSDADIDDAKAELEKHLDDIHSFEIVRI